MGVVFDFNFRADSMWWFLGKRCTQEVGGDDGLLEWILMQCLLLDIYSIDSDDIFVIKC